MDREEQSTNESVANKTIFVNQSVYSYHTKPFMLINALGFVRAALTEYIVTGMNGTTYKLYKTSEHNWYDMEDTNAGAGNNLLNLLKVEIDFKEKSGL